jgi:stalled ribosome rescue protein Dom34
MERFIDLDKWTPAELTMKIDGNVYSVKDVTVEMFLELLEICESGLKTDKDFSQTINELRKSIKNNRFVTAIKKIKQFLRFGKPISEDAAKRKLARFLKKMVPSLPNATLKAMSQTQIQGFLEFLTKTYYEGQTDPNFQKPMASI